MLQEMRACGIAPTHVTILIFIKMYGKASLLDKAIMLSKLGKGV